MIRLMHVAVGRYTVNCIVICIEKKVLIFKSKY